MTPRNIKDYLAVQKKLVDQQLDRLLPTAEAYPPVIHTAMRYSLFAGGKRIRPALALATGQALRGDPGGLLDLACSLEMIHTYSLIHDDLPAMDNDDFRRGRPTVHKKYGEGIAILAGNGLLTRAFEVLALLSQGAVPANVGAKIMARICRAIGTSGGMMAGQAVDLLTQGKPFTREELEYIHSAKTGALLRASVTTAALLSGAEDAQLDRLSRFGAKIGLAFQVVDDMLDVEGSSREMGKQSGQDVVEQKATYPALMGLGESRKIAECLVEEAIAQLEFLGQRAERLRQLARFISIRRF